MQRRSFGELTMEVSVQRLRIWNLKQLIKVDGHHFHFFLLFFKMIVEQELLFFEGMIFRSTIVLGVRETIVSYLLYGQTKGDYI